jgi:excisionase family DNA binding protein
MPTPQPIKVEDLPPVLNVDEAAAVLRVSRGLIYEGVRSGQIAAAKLGKKGVLRIKREVILALLASAA